MEKIVRIMQAQPLQERNYTDRNGQQQVFASRGFVLSDGIDTFYAEAVGDYARSLPPDFNTGANHRLQAQLSMREYRDKEGGFRYATEIRIVKIVQL